MELLDLPNELLFEIIQLLEYGWDLTAFGVTNRHLHGLVSTYLYQQTLPNCSDAVLQWIVEKGNEDAFAQCLKANILAYVDKRTTSMLPRKAISLGQDRILELLIKNGISSFHDEGGTGPRADLRRYWDTLLFYAGRKGHIAVARILIAYGMDSFDSPRNKSLLLSAASSGDLEMIRYLLEEVGLSPNQQSNGGYTALASAASSGQARAVTLLLEHGANPNLRMRGEGLPLTIAAEQGHIEVVRVLLAHGTNVNPVPGEELPIYSAMGTIGGNKMAMTRLIADNMDLDLLRTRYENQVTLLTIAAALGKDGLVQELLQEDCYPDDEWIDGVLFHHVGSQGPLEWAAEAGHDSVVKLLLQYGIDGNFQKPLVLALKNGHPRVAKILLDRYVEQFRRTSWFDELLLSALENDECFELLLDHGANPTGIWNEGEHLNQHVLESGRPALAQALVRRGFPLELPVSSEGNRGGATLLSATRGGVPMLETLLQNGFDFGAASHDDIQGAIRDSIRREDVPVASFFLNRGFRLDNDDLLPGCIAHAARLNSSDSPSEMLLDTLLRGGVDINTRGEHQRTCIWNSISDYHANQLDVLLQRGADPRLRDENGETPLIFAATRTPQLICYENYVQTILEWFDLHWAEQSSEELYRELTKAETGALTHGNRKIARVLQRFRRVHFDRV
ncbi:ankyrin [Penicillium cataractarum]|uniref:Ankyrin n=1 Tax=Penicillium cataractarum TaxID=2100454 RepID=A0A9W9UVN5_9EURO|nr:ankyrin [Penicillium cataractarum]KAJ5359228.1 ankyrin [Penicillium cataractarum]